MEILMEPKTHVTRREAAEQLGVSIQTIDNYIRDGRLAASKIGPRLVRIPVTAVEALLAGGGDEV